MGTWSADTDNPHIGDYNHWALSMGPCSDGVHIIVLMGKGVQSPTAYKMEPEGWPDGDHKWTSMTNPVIPPHGGSAVAIPSPTGYLIDGKTYFFVDVGYTEGRVVWWDDAAGTWSVGAPGPTSQGAWSGMCREPGTDRLWTMTDALGPGWAIHYYDISADAWTLVDGDSNAHLSVNSVSSRAMFHDGTNLVVVVEDRFTPFPWKARAYIWNGTTWTAGADAVEYGADGVGAFAQLNDGTLVLINDYERFHYTYDIATDTWGDFDPFVELPEYAESEGQGTCMFNGRLFTSGVQYWDEFFTSRSGEYSEVWVWEGDEAPPSFDAMTQPPALPLRKKEELPHIISERDTGGDRAFAKKIQENFDAIQRQLHAIEIVEE